MAGSNPSDDNETNSNMAPSVFYQVYTVQALKEPFESFIKCEGLARSGIWDKQRFRVGVQQPMRYLHVKVGGAPFGDHVIEILL